MSKLIIYRSIESILAPTKVEQNIHYDCVLGTTWSHRHRASIRS